MTLNINNSFIPKNANAMLIFADGRYFFGKGIGYQNVTIGEICFNTSITGYQEILTDPSYTNQIINFTFPHIGNVGTNDEDYETEIPKVKGLIIRNSITSPSNYRSQHNLENWLHKHKITGIAGIDTRSITKYIRQKGPQNCLIYYSDKLDIERIKELYNNLKQTPNLKGIDLAKQVTCKDIFPWHKPRWQEKVKELKYNVVAIDYGIKHNILRSLASFGCNVTVVPSYYSYEKILSLNPDGIFLSNGPGDPAATAEYSVPILKNLIDQNIPIFGICLGHQLLALALGGNTKKMHQGHRGANHPVKNLLNNKVEITSQNHGFEIDESSLPSDVIITHRSLFDNSIEGIAHKTKPVFAVQYHPESSPGPHDSYYLFKKFIAMMQANKLKTNTIERTVI